MKINEPARATDALSAGQSERNTCADRSLPNPGIISREDQSTEPLADVGARLPHDGLTGWASRTGSASSSCSMAGIIPTAYGVRSDPPRSRPLHPRAIAQTHHLSPLGDVDWPACSRSAFQREHRVRSPRQGRRWSTTPPKHETPSAGSGWAPYTHIIQTQGQCPSLASARAVGGSTPLGPESRVAGARTSTVRLRSQGGQTRSKVPASPPLARPSHPALAC